MIQFACPSCAAVFSVGDEKAGKTGKCPKCDAKFVIPDAEPGAAPSPPLPVDDNVEIKPCPGCQAKLTVARGDIGLDVECPYCKTVYKAAKAGGSSAVIRTDRPSKRSAPVEDDEDDRPSRRRRRDEDDDEDDRASQRRDRSDDDDDRPRKKRRSRNYEPHRGGMVLAFGIISFFVCAPIFGPMAMIMGGNDLKKIDAGRMDPEGRSMTQIGRILGIIATVLFVLAILFYCVIIVIAIAAGPGAGPGPRGR
jgi:DNA-directed RNA polymerase subunit M/transcription elongation factor TFIIS